MYNYAENALNVFQNRDRMRLEAQKAQAKANQQRGNAADNALGQAMQMMQMQQMITQTTEQADQMRKQLQKQHLNNIGRARAVWKDRVEKLSKEKDPKKQAALRAEIAQIRADINIYSKKNKDYFPEEYKQMLAEADRLEQESQPLREVDDWNDDEARIAKTFLNNRLNGKGIGFSNNYTTSQDWIDIKRNQGAGLDKQQRVTYMANDPRVKRGETPEAKEKAKQAQQAQQAQPSENPEAMGNRLDAGIDTVLNAPEAGDGPVSKMSAEDTAKFKQSQQPQEQPQEQQQEQPQEQPQEQQQVDLANLSDTDLYNIMRGNIDYLGLDEAKKLELLKAVEALKLGRVYNSGFYDTDYVTGLLAADSEKEYSESYGKILSQEEIAADRFDKESIASDIGFNSLYNEIGYSDAEASLKEDNLRHSILDADQDIINKQQAIRDNDFPSIMKAKPGSRERHNMLNTGFMGQTNEKGQAAVGSYTNPVVSSGGNSDANKVYTGGAYAVTQGINNFVKRKGLKNKDGSQLILNSPNDVYKAVASGTMSKADYEELKNEKITYNSVVHGKKIETTIGDAMYSGYNKLAKELRIDTGSLADAAKALSTENISEVDAIIGNWFGSGITSNFTTVDQRKAALLAGYITNDIVTGSKQEGNTYISGPMLDRMAGLFTNGQNSDTSLKTLLDLLQLEKAKCLNKKSDTDFGVVYAGMDQALEIDNAIKEVNALYNNAKAFRSAFPDARVNDNTPGTKSNAEIAYDSKENTVTFRYKGKIYTYKDGKQIKL